uniref:Mediator-associated protein 1 n=1 Tax=Noccaea caerulescens TaxID=107243 RepID=A0A1J3CU94_NOCCA
MSSSPTSESLSRRKSPRQRASASEAVVAGDVEEPQKKKSKTDKLASPSNRIWNEDEEVALLKGIVDYRAERGLEPNADWDAFHRFFGDSMAAKFSKEQMRSKIRSLKGKFRTRIGKIKQGDKPIFTEDEAFRYSNMIWGKNDSEIANQRENVEETVEEEDEQVAAANVQPLNVAEKTDFGEEEEHIEDEQVAAVNVQPINEENVGARTEFDDGNDNDTDAADESCTVRDAFETLVSQGLRECQKKLQLQNLMNLDAGKRREISQEWKALSAEEVQMEIKKLRFLAKLVEAANDQ